MNLIDSHAHLTAPALAEDVPAVLSRAASAGVTSIITVAVDLPDARRALDLASRYGPSPHAPGEAKTSGHRPAPTVHAAIGIHPHEAGKMNDADWPKLEQLARDDRVVAVGEMGLDHHYDFSDRKAQQRVFERQLELASVVDKPVIIHCREAHSDAVAILKTGGFTGRPVVFHCFSGTRAEASEIAQNGWRVSFTGLITFANADDLAALAADYDIDQLMIETDAPYLSPVPVRNVRPNEPAHLVHTARFLAEKRKTSFEAICEATERNTRSFFRLRQPYTHG